MRHILIISLLYYLLTCCTDDHEEFPISNLQLPTTATNWQAGDLITIKGEGFTSNSEIFLQKWTGQTANPSPLIKATISEITSSFLIFIAPEVSGEYVILLIEGDKQFALGSLNFYIPGEQIPLIHKITEHQGDEIYVTTYNYDANNRIIEIRESYENAPDGSQETRTLYEYREKQIYSEYWDYYVEVPDTIIFHLNQDNLISSYNVSYPDPTNNHNEVFIYNTGQQLIRTIYSDDDIIWTEGNITQIKPTSGSSEFNFVYTTYENKILPDLTSLTGDFDYLKDPILMSSGYFGQRNHNLLASYSSSYANIPGGPIFTTTYSFEYTFGKDGFVTQIKEYSVKGNDKTLRNTMLIEYR